MSDRASRIAVVGIGCRFPGGADSPDAFWRLLESGSDVIGPMPAGRFAIDRLVDREPRTPGKVVTAEGGFLERIDAFDAEFFGISPREARKIDPQQRLLLEVAWEALEDAGIPARSLAGSRTGVYVGLWSGEYEHVMARRLDDMDLYATTGGGRYAAAGRIAFAIDARGPAMTVDTACSSSLVAMHLAARALQTGDADVAIAGAANLILQPFVSVAYSRSGMLSPGARCRFGAPGPDGYVRSEGAAAIVLKRLEDAVRDGDPIQAVLLGSAVNSDGRGSDRLVAPSLDAQMAMLREAYADAGIDPSEVDYIEAHGTGTQAGDIVELTALGRVLAAGRRDVLPVGSVKRLIGHTEAASGFAGVLKAILAFRARRVPSGGHERERNPDIPWSELRVAIATDPIELREGAIIGVNSFGVTGTNAHVILAAPPATPAASSTASKHAAVVTVSGRDAKALQEAARRLHDFLDDPQRVDASTSLLNDLFFTTACRRDHHAHRIAIVAESVQDVIGGLKAYTAGEAAPQVFDGVADAANAPRIAFVFSGQGSQWLGMGRELLKHAPVFAASLQRCDELTRALAGWSVLEILNGSSAAALEPVAYVQPTLTCVQIALAGQLRAWGVVPGAVVGHSMGEVAAAYVAGALSLEDAVRVIVTRSRLLAEIAGAGAMALVDLDESETAKLIADASDRVSIAAVNGPRSTVISGDPAIIDDLLEKLDDDGVFCRRVKVDVASHSPQTEPLLPHLAAELASLKPQVPAIPFYSTPRPGSPTHALLDAAYWVDNLRKPVQLRSAVQAMIADGFDTFIEVAPHPVLLSSLADIAADANAAVRTFAGPRRDEPEMRRVLDLLAKLHVNGVSVAWNELAPKDARVVRVPTYPWQRERHWLDRWEDWSGDNASAAAEVDRPELADRAVFEVEWRPVENAAAGSGVAGTWFMLPDARGVADRLADLLRARGAQVMPVTPAELAAQFESARKLKLPIRGVIHMASLDARVADDNTPRDALRLSAGHVLDTIHALLSIDASTMTWWITRGVQNVPGRAAEKSAWPGAATWGIARTLWEEHPELGARLVDVDADGDAIAAQVFRALTHASEPQLAFAGDALFAARLVAAPDALRPPPAARADAAWLITGGTGALGAIAAEELVRHGARHIVLMARTPLPPRREWSKLTAGPVHARVQRILRLESLGASVQIAAVDAGNAAELSAWLEAYRAERRPEIHGIVHCAGELDNALLRDLSHDSVLRLMAGKAIAAHNLDVLLPDVEHTIYFSSTVPVLPQPGQANYAAANAALDALACARSAVGKRTISLAWGVWKDAGLVSDVNVRRHVAGMEAGGQASLEESDARALFRWAIAADRPHLVLAPMDWSIARARLASRPGAAFYSELTGRAAEAEPTASLRDALGAAPAEQRPAMLAAALRVQVAQILDVAPERINPNHPLGRQGLDSLMALEFRNRMEAQLDLRLPASLTWNYPTLEKLSEHLLQRLNIAAADVKPIEVPAGTSKVEVAVGLAASVRSEIEQLSDDDILQQLRLEA